MRRRQFLHGALAAGIACVAGCLGGTDSSSSPTQSPTGSPSPTPSPTDSPTPHDRSGNPAKPYDTLTLHPMPAYVTGYEDSVVVEYASLDEAAKRAVREALEAEDSYREPTTGKERTDVLAFLSHIEARWAETGESFEHTYLNHEGEYYGISLVQEGDHVRVYSIPCTEEACPTTPTPPA